MARATDESDRLVAEACERSVELVVTHPELAERLTLKRGRARSSGLASRIDPAAQRLALFLAIDDETDCAEIDGDGLMPAILALPTIATAPADVFLATSAAERTAAGKWTVTRARVVLEFSTTCVRGMLGPLFAEVWEGMSMAGQDERVGRPGVLGARDSLDRQPRAAPVSKARS